MERKKIVITGSNGVIGSILRGHLQEYKITPMDLPEVDVREYDKLLQIFPGHDGIIHLAWDKKTENFRSGKINPDNSSMTCNVYRAAVETGVPRVIMASSVHADSYSKWEGPGLLKPDRIPVPDSPYGASKLFMEALGRHYAQDYGLEVVCIRFGGINLRDRVNPENKDSKVWLSQRDCVSLIKKCLEVSQIPNNYEIIYAISKNSNRTHDYSNSLGWEPKDDVLNKK